MKLTVNVTAEHIQQGCPGACMACPVALAIAAAAGTNDVFAGPTYLWVRRQRANTPEVVKNFINKFDCDVPGLSPFSFTVEFQDVPQES